MKNIRKEKNITQAQIATKLGVSVNTISSMELANTKISFPRIIELCEVLKISIFDLLKNTGIEIKEESEDFVNKYNKLNYIDKQRIREIIDLFIKTDNTLTNSTIYNKPQYSKSDEEYLDKFFDADR